MKRYFTKIISALLALVLIMSCSTSAFAMETNEDNYTIEVVPNEEIDAKLPSYLVNALNTEGEVIPYGISKPSSDNVHDLSSGRYDFEVSTKLNTTIYSRYIFTGHEGSVTFYLNDSSTDSGSYTVKVYKRGIFDTVIKTKKNCEHGEVSTFTFSSIDPEAKIFFAIIPDGTTNISGYIKKGE